MPIQVGDLVDFQGARWLVSTRNRSVRTVILRQLDGTATEVADDDSACRVIANLPTAWPFVTIPKKASPIEDIHITRQGRTMRVEPMVAWAPQDPLHNGGVLYFHPKLNLRTGEVLVARHKNGSLTKISVTPTYGTAQRKIQLGEAKHVEAPQTRFDRLLLDEDDEDA